MSVVALSFRDRRRPEEDRCVVDTTSRARNWSRALSPFFLGPVELWGGYVARNVENAWQFSKVYHEHLGDLERWLAWARTGWNDARAHRYPMGKERKPICSYWNGKDLTYVEARRQIYIPLYAKAVRETKAFEKLKALYEFEEKVTLLDFDAYRLAPGTTWDQVIDDPTRKMGHAFVLAMMLEGFVS